MALTLTAIPDAPASVVRLTGLAWPDALDLVMIYEVDFLTRIAGGFTVGETAMVGADDIVSKTFEDRWSSTAAGKTPANWDGTYEGAIKYMLRALRSSARDLGVSAKRYSETVTTVAAGDVNAEAVLDSFEESVDAIARGNGGARLSAEAVFFRAVDLADGIKSADSLLETFTDLIDNPKRKVAFAMWAKGRSNADLEAALGKWAVKDLYLAKKKVAAALAELDGEVL